TLRARQHLIFVTAFRQITCVRVADSAGDGEPGPEVVARGPVFPAKNLPFGPRDVEWVPWPSQCRADSRGLPFVRWTSVPFWLRVAGPIPVRGACLHYLYRDRLLCIYLGSTDLRSSSSGGGYQSGIGVVPMGTLACFCC